MTPQQLAETIKLLPDQQLTRLNYSPNTPEGRAAGMEWWRQQQESGNTSTGPAQSLQKMATGIDLTNAALKEELKVAVTNPEEIRPKQPVAVTVTNNFAATDLNQEEIANAVSASILNAMTDAGYGSVGE